MNPVFLGFRQEFHEVLDTKGEYDKSKKLNIYVYLLE